MPGVELRLGITSETKGRVANIPEIVPEIFLNHLALVTEAKDELVEAVMRIGLHDMPEDRALADGQHRFGAELRFVLQTCPLAAAQDNHFHRLVRCSML